MAQTAIKTSQEDSPVPVYIGFAVEDLSDPDDRTSPPQPTEERRIRAYPSQQRSKI